MTHHSFVSTNDYCISHHNKSANIRQVLHHGRDILPARNKLTNGNVVLEFLDSSGSCEEQLLSS